LNFQSIMDKKKIINIFSVFFLITVSSYAKEPLWLVQANPSARIKSLGGAGTALSDNSSAMSINPGSFSYMPNGQLSLFYGNLHDSSHHVYIEYIYPFATAGSLGSSAEINFKDVNNSLQNYSMGFSLRILKSLSAGTAVRAITGNLNGFYGQAVGFDAGLHIRPCSWMNIGIAWQNINQPEVEYDESGVTETVEPVIRGGLSIYKINYINILSDVIVENYNSDTKDLSFKGYYGVEIFPDPSFAVRGGIKDGSWRMGMGLVSGKVCFDYAFSADDDGLTHYFQYTLKFAVAETRKEKELKQKERELAKDSVYLEALRLFNKQNMASAQAKISEYVNAYGEDRRITELKDDVEKWLDKERKEKIGRAKEIKKEIMKDYFRGKITDARIKLENAKLLAPNYEDLQFLEHLLNARELLEQGEYKKSEEELVEALKIDPDSQEVKDLHKRLQEVLKLSK